MGGIRVTEALGNDSNGCAGLQENGRVAVSETVKVEHREPRVPDRPLEVAEHRVRVHRTAELIGEDAC